MAIKQQIIQLLEENRNTTLSGQELADQLGVTRAAVWKTMKGLQEEGYPIAASRNKGYALGENSDILSEQALRIYLPKQNHSGDILVYKTVDSTNSLAKKLIAEGIPHQSILVAEEQTAGRGRLGRSFFSPPGTGLYMSLILRPNETVRDALFITIAAAVAVCHAMEALTEALPQIKWVNDIFLGNRKICGILTEAMSDLESGMAEAIIVGIGINVKPPDAGFPDELEKIAGSLLPKALTRNQLAAKIAEELFWFSERLSDPSVQEELIFEYKKRSLVMGRSITFQQNGVRHTGVVRDINQSGNLIVDAASGRMILQAGEITIGSDLLC